MKEMLFIAAVVCLLFSVIFLPLIFVGGFTLFITVPVELGIAWDLSK